MKKSGTFSAFTMFQVCARLADDRREAESRQTWMEEARRELGETNPGADGASMRIVHQVVRKPRRGK
jgi:hypothetical protein